MKEREQLKEFIQSESSENAKDHLVFPLFQKLFGNKFKKQSDAYDADIYIDGKLLVELKSKTEDSIGGFFQALHYSKKGLSFSSVCVITYRFIGVWKVNAIPDFAKKYSFEADALKSPSEIGVSIARKVSKSQKNDIFKSAIFSFTPLEKGSFFEDDIDAQISMFVDVLRNLQSERLQVNPHNFISTIEVMKKFFTDPLDAIHFFYAIVGYWTTSSKVTTVGESDFISIIDNTRGNERSSEPIKIVPRHYAEIKLFVESRFIFTNEGSGLTVDYYFSRFDEVITKVDPEYAKQHGIFFTDHNLSKFALWFVKEFFENKLSEKYIVLDPAGGSGNLVMSWKGHLKHKIVCELQPDLLKMIFRRMQLDPEHLRTGFTVVPKTSKNEGLNFLNKPAEEYIRILANALKEKDLSLDKPFAFLLNPPYKNTDENVSVRKDKNAHYEIDPTILELTGEDAGKERYLGFLSQIVNISRLQMGDSNPVEGKMEFSETIHTLDKNKVKEKPLLLIFTPSSWLIPRPTYVTFRNIFDKYYKYEKGFIITGSEFFKIAGRFPISFTIWSYHFNPKGNKNKVIVRDLTNIKHNDLKINWNLPNEFINTILKSIWKNSKDVLFDNSRGDIRDFLPLIKNYKTNNTIKQTRYDYSTAKKENEFNKIVSGFPQKDFTKHFELKRKCGDPSGNYVGFYDDNTPVRILQDSLKRMSSIPDRIWFRLDNVFINLNQTKIHSGAPDKYGFCAFDLETARSTVPWFAITKALNGVYPVWANQFDLWAPDFNKLNLPEKQTKEFQKYFYSLCFAFALAENRCVVTKFEKDNPVKDAPEVFVDNPLCPTNPESFWSTTLDKEIPRFVFPAKAGIQEKLVNPAYTLINMIKELYELWNKKYCKGEYLYNIGLQDEPYFKYFDYADFLTPHSGLIQIKKFAELHNHPDLSELFRQITSKSKQIKDEIYNILVNQIKYFE